jgi:GT2 family glycosyltransferase
MSSGSGVVAITVNWNRATDTIECLRSVENGGVGNVKLVVVDNGSQSDVISTISKEMPGVSIIEMGANEGYVKGANAGLNYALRLGASHVLLINNDAVGSPGFLSNLIQAFDRHPSAGVVGPKILYHGREVIWFAGGSFNKSLGFSRHSYMDERDFIEFKDRKIDFITGCTMLIRADVLKEIGTLDEDFGMYAEDLEFCLRAVERGYESWLVPSAIVSHKVSLSAGIGGSNIMTPTRSYYYARNMPILVKKRMRGMSMVTCLIGQFVVRLPYYTGLILKQKSRGGLKAYLRGTKDGIKFLLGGSGRSA